ncbi:hypothetical protein An03g04450 [Aspergillus niger]|uniref:Uncharacterized protein n=2 Tax=Aspergillus niger TaxID=5061 RepID=A2QGT7_ASPNC|nr:hypothetical protein An03g04450 [Aspergillus niger]CAK38237.1 hypothetical protein An03g04450 [Aspergillus niger]
MAESHFRFPLFTGYVLSRLNNRDCPCMDTATLVGYYEVSARARLPANSKCCRIASYRRCGSGLDRPDAPVRLIVYQLVVWISRIRVGRSAFNLEALQMPVPKSKDIMTGPSLDRLGAVRLTDIGPKGAVQRRPVQSVRSSQRSHKPSEITRLPISDVPRVAGSTCRLAGTIGTDAFLGFHSVVMLQECETNSLRARREKSAKQTTKAKLMLVRLNAYRYGIVETEFDKPWEDSEASY